MWYRRTIPLMIVFATGVLGFAHDYIPHPLSGEFREEMTSWFRIIGGFAMFLGTYSLLHMHIARIRRRTAGWGYSVFVFLGAALMIGLGVYNEGKWLLEPPAKLAGGALTEFEWCYDHILVPCQATIFSILAFYIASAAFRTFRARNLAAALLLVAAILVMRGRVPIADLTGIRLFGDDEVCRKIADYVMEVPNLAAKRGILLGVSLGAISQSLRILFGIERSYLGGGD